MDRMLKKISLFFLFLSALLLFGKGWHWAKDGFHLLRVRHPPFGLNNPPIDPLFLTALSEPYFYIGRGHQCYAFASRSGKYVLKLPRLDRYELPFWLRACRFSPLDAYREALLADVKHRHRFIEESFKIALNDLPQETGILYLHWNRTDHLNCSTTITDRLGRTYRIDLDRTPFILQRKEALMMPLFQKSLQTGDRKEAKRILEAFLQVIAARSKKGIFNKDPSFLRNFGYGEEGQGIQIDIGSFYRKANSSEKKAFEDSFRETAAHVHNWLSSLDPEMQEWFDKRVEEYASYL